MSDLTDDPFLPGGETLAGARKRVLLGALAEAEAARLGLEVSEARVAEVSRWFRARFDLLTREKTEAFLAESGLTLADFTRLCRELALLDAVERHHAAAVDERLPAHLRLMSVRDFVLRREGR